MHRKVYFLIIIFIILVVLIITFTIDNSNSLESQKLRIVTTIYPYELLVGQITGDRAEVTSFIPPDASPHTYSPTPNDMKVLENADLVISNGMDLEVFLERAFVNIADKHIRAAEFLPDEIAAELNHHNSKHLEKSHSSNHPDHSHNSHDHHHEANPHFWLDPLLIITVAEGITERIITLDQDSSEHYRKRLEKLQTELVTLDQEIREERESLGELNIVNFHDAFYYFNKRYDINRVAVVVKSPGKEPSPRELVNIGNLINKHQVRVIFLEPQLNPKAAEIIAREHNLRTETLDPLGSYINASSVPELIYFNWQIMKEHF